MPRTQPPLPAACVPLLNEDLARLRAARPRLWGNPAERCLTCLHETKQGDHTYRWWADPEQTEVATYECRCRDQWQLHCWLLDAGIGLAYQRLSWDDVTAVPAHIQDQVMTYAVNGQRNVATGRNLVLWSKEPGTGKTLLLTLLIKTLMASQGLDAHFAQFQDIIDLHTGGWRKEEERAHFTRRVRNIGILGIDDIGKEHPGRSEIVDPMVDQIIRARVADSLPVVISTNKTPDELRALYGDYAMSLLAEQADFIEVTGTNFRPQRNAASQREADLGLSRPITVV